MEFTFLMPCLNEAQSLAFCIREAQSAIDRLGLDAEILIADNGSTDGSDVIARENGARVTYVARKGYGSALMGGIHAARGHYIIMGDCDGSYDFGHPDAFIDALREGAALVVGDRFRGGIEPGAMPWSHRWGVPMLSRLAGWRFGSPVRDFHCGLRAFERRALLELGLTCPGMEFATEMIAAFARSRAPVAQVPTVLRKDLRTGKPHVRTVRDGLRHLYFILFGLRTPGKSR